MTEQASTLLPSLRARQTALQAELVKERETAAEISACDPQEVADYRAAIYEQRCAMSV